MHQAVSTNNRWGSLLPFLYADFSNLSTVSQCS